MPPNRPSRQRKQATASGGFPTFADTPANGEVAPPIAAIHLIEVGAAGSNPGVYRRAP
jgi:hypothetical protein